MILSTGRFTGSSTAAFPYLLAAKEDQTIYLPDCVPEGFSLGDPDHIPSSKINSLYNHWLERQRKKMAPFVIINAGPLQATVSKKLERSMAKGKKTDYVDVDSSDDSEEDCDEDDEWAGIGELEVLPSSPTKFGPPKSKRAIVNAEAGPSSQKNPKKRGRGRPPKTPKGGLEEAVVMEVVPQLTNSLKNSKGKRKAIDVEEDVHAESPKKLQKTAAVRKSSRINGAGAEVEKSEQVSGSF